jgi:hypothetical protein
VRPALRALLAALGVAACAAAWPATASAGTASAGASVAVREPHVVCSFSDERLVEISGITWSRRHPGVYCAQRPGRGPYLRRRRRIHLRHARPRAHRQHRRARPRGGCDAPIRRAAVLWLADIGDNRDSWPSVRLHAVVEPARLVDQQVDAVTYRFTYADIPHNAEGSSPRRTALTSGS